MRRHVIGKKTFTNCVTPPVQDACSSHGQKFSGPFVQPHRELWKRYALIPAFVVAKWSKHDSVQNKHKGTTLKVSNFRRWYANLREKSYTHLCPPVISNNICFSIQNVSHAVINYGAYLNTTCHAWYVPKWILESYRYIQSNAKVQTSNLKFATWKYLFIKQGFQPKTDCVLNRS